MENNYLFDRLTELPLGLAGRVFRSPMPYSTYDPDESLVEEYLQVGVENVVLLAENDEYRSRTGRDLKSIYLEMGMDVIHLPIPDFGVPEVKSLESAVEKTLQHISEGNNTVIHCYAGIGRTGTFAACLAKRVLGLSGDESIQWVRNFIPGAVEVQTQINLVRNF
jgi:protein-tyrosine phosphatase